MSELAPVQACDNIYHEILNISFTYRTVLLDWTSRNACWSMLYVLLFGWTGGLNYSIGLPDAILEMSFPRTGIEIITASDKTGCRARRRRYSQFSEHLVAPLRKISTLEIVVPQLLFYTFWLAVWIIISLVQSILTLLLPCYYHVFIQDIWTSFCVYIEHWWHTYL